MGMAASQARFLSLTARLSDNEYEAQQISQERLSLADQMGEVSDEYEKATSNQTYLVTIFENNGNTKTETQLTYQTVTEDVFKGGLGLRVTTASGLIAVPDEAEMERMKKSDPTLKDNDFYIFEEMKNTDTFQRNLDNGNLYISTPTENGNGKTEWVQKSPAAIGNVRKVYDTQDDAAAKAKYDSKMRKLEKEDAMFEMELERLDSEHKAIQTELDSVKKVVDDNVEKSFKTFG